MYVTLLPAYGRDYKSQKEAKEDWQAGKDFVIACFGHPNDGSYINRTDWITGGKTEKLTIRYAKSTKTVNVS